MSESNEEFISKDVCEEKHKAVNDKFIDLKANIHTSKESLSNRLDEVDTALLGDRRSPGGLLRDFVDVKNELKDHKDNINEKLQRHEKQVGKDFVHHQEKVASNVKFLSKAVWIAMGLSVMALGGRFFGISIDMIKGMFSVEQTPVVAPAPPVEENTEIPEELQQMIKDFINAYDKYEKIPEENNVINELTDPHNPIGENK
jgi:hypothetical protein